MMLSSRDFQSLNGLSPIREKDMIMIFMQDQFGIKQFSKLNMNKHQLHQEMKDSDLTSFSGLDLRIILQDMDLDTSITRSLSPHSIDTKEEWTRKIKTLFGHSKMLIKKLTQEESLE